MNNVLYQRKLLAISNWQLAISNWQLARSKLPAASRQEQKISCRK
jgi:hypothetical protein